jgi:hypothetical protein
LLLCLPNRNGIAATYYNRADEAAPEVCLAERLAACSGYVAELYAHSKYCSDFFLGSYPDLPYRFEFPTLSPDELTQANKVIAELSARRPVK